jgi:hypothetical protein
MKTYLLGLILFALAATSSSAETFSSSVGSTREAIAGRPSRVGPIYRKGVYGMVPRAFGRGRNPLQMLNPHAPAKYGTGEESASFDPHIPGRCNGIKFFEIVF